MSQQEADVQAGTEAFGEKQFRQEHENPVEKLEDAAEVRLRGVGESRVRSQE